MQKAQQDTFRRVVIIRITETEFVAEFIQFFQNLVYNSGCIQKPETLRIIHFGRPDHA
jgi:hypothetical protein